MPLVQLLAGKLLRGRGHELHEPERADVRDGEGIEPRLDLDDGGDEQRVEPVALRLAHDGREHAALVLGQERIRLDDAIETELLGGLVVLHLVDGAVGAQLLEPGLHLRERLFRCLGALFAALRGLDRCRGRECRARDPIVLAGIRRAHHPERRAGRSRGDGRKKPHRKVPPPAGSFPASSRKRSSPSKDQARHRRRRRHPDPPEIRSNCRSVRPTPTTARTFRARCP